MGNGMGRWGCTLGLRASSLLLPRSQPHGEALSFGHSSAYTLGQRGAEPAHQRLGQPHGAGPSHRASASRLSRADLAATCDGNEARRLLRLQPSVLP